MKTVKNIIFVSIALMGISALAMQETSAELGRKLLLAADDGKLDEVRDLIEHGDSDINYSNGIGCTPLIMASQNGHTAIVRLLLEAGADIDKAKSDGVTHLILASQNGHLNVVELLLSHNPSPDINVQAEGLYNNTALIQAALGGHEAIVQLLLDKGANINQASGTGITPLYAASIEGHLDVLRLLLDRGANVDAQAFGSKNRTALYQAIEKGYDEIVKLFLERGANVDLARCDGFTPLMAASEKGNVEVVKLLLEKKPAINAQAQGCNNVTALIQAVYFGHAEIVRLLLENGAEVDLARIDGATPLLVASQYGHLDVIKLLLTAISDADAEWLSTTISEIEKLATKSTSAMKEIIDPWIKIFFEKRMGRAHAMMSKKNNAGKDAFDLYADKLGLSADRRDAIRKGNMEILSRVLKRSVENRQLTLLNPTDSKSQDELKALIESNMAQFLSIDQMKALDSKKSRN